MTDKLTDTRAEYHVCPPTPKSEVAIKVAITSGRYIVFDATQDAAGEIERAKFGELLRRKDDGSYRLLVDARFDFDEVVEYIQSYGQPSEPEAKPANLLPCPFCGGDRPYLSKVLRDGYQNFQDDEDAYAHYVVCHACACCGPWAKSETGAARWWNMRTQK